VNTARFWTRKCNKRCGDNSPHNAHLTLFGKLMLKLAGRRAEGPSS
jgi:hypothetical protein